MIAAIDGGVTPEPSINTKRNGNSTNREYLDLLWRVYWGGLQSRNIPLVQKYALHTQGSYHSTKKHRIEFDNSDQVQKCYD